MTTPTDMQAASSAARLLDAQVAWVLAQLDGERLTARLDDDVREVWDIASGIRLDALVTAEDIMRLIDRYSASVPASTAVSTLVHAGAEVVHAGPDEPVVPSEVVERSLVDQLVTEVIALHPILERNLEQLTDSPLVGALASRFLSRIAAEVFEANRAVAEKIPGMGSLFAVGTSAASKVMGAADRPLQMVGDTANKGAALAIRRLNKVVIDTIKDPLLRQAVMEVWDQHADTAIDPVNEQDVTVEQVQRIAGLLQEAVIGAAPTPPVRGLVAGMIDRFFSIYGEYPPTTLLEELGITLDDIIEEAHAIVPRVLAEAQAEGRLEQLVRSRLAPFYASPEVAAILADA